MPAASTRATRFTGSLWLPRVELAAVVFAVLVLSFGLLRASAALVLVGAVLGFAGEAAFAVSGRRIEDVLSRGHLGSSTRTLLLQGLFWPARCVSFPGSRLGDPRRAGRGARTGDRTGRLRLSDQFQHPP